MNSDVIKTIFFYDDKEHGKMAIENQKGEMKRRSKEDILNEIQRKVGSIFLNYTVVKDQNLITYQFHQENGSVELRVGASDEALPNLRKILSELSRKVIQEEKPKDRITVTIGDEGTFIFYTSNQETTSEEIDRDATDIIGYIRCLKNNNEITSSFRDGKENLCYTFETIEGEKIKIYVRRQNEEMVKRLDELASVKIKKQSKKGLFKIASISAGVVLCATTGVVLFAKPSIGRDIVEGVQTIHQKHEEQNEAYELIESNLPRIKSLYRRFNQNELSEEEVLELRNKVNKVLTYLQEIESKDECISTLEKYAEEVESYFTTSYRGTIRR